MQGRGSAANSAVCVVHWGCSRSRWKGLLFERFLSEERGGCPDIDVWIWLAAMNGRVRIQYIYQRYGALGATDGERY